MRQYQHFFEQNVEMNIIDDVRVQVDFGDDMQQCTSCPPDWAVSLTLSDENTMQRWLDNMSRKKTWDLLWVRFIKFATWHVTCGDFAGCKLAEAFSKPI